MEILGVYFFLCVAGAAFFTLISMSLFGPATLLKEREEPPVKVIYKADNAPSREPASRDR